MQAMAIATPNMAIDLDTQHQKAALPQFVVSRSFLRWISKGEIMRTIKKRAFFVNAAIAFAVCTSAVSAQDTSADRQAAATRYMSIVPMSNMLEDSYAELAKQLPPDRRAGFTAKMRQTVRADALERIAFESMIKTFTADELNALADFYESKPGRSAMQKLGIYMGQVMPALQAEIQRSVQQQSSQK
jgi:hypothetical protein